MGHDADLVHSIHEHLVGYLADETTVDDFVSWFAPATQSAIDHTGLVAEQTVSEIRLVLAEFGRGDRSEDELRDALRDVAKTASGVIREPGQPVHKMTVTGSGSMIVFRSASVDQTLINR